jgi:hypothetical protein
MVALKFKKVGIKRVGPKSRRRSKSTHGVQKVVAVQKVRPEFKKVGIKK